jgi:hypothetical protein
MTITSNILRRILRDIARVIRAGEGRSDSSAELLSWTVKVVCRKSARRIEIKLSESGASSARN